MNENIILIGMPGAGKSTVSVVLAKKLGMNFLDSDIVIQERTGKLLHEIISESGIDEFNRIEDSVNASLCVTNTIIATGGSVIYGKNAMEHLKSIGKIFYLKLSYEEIEERLGDLRKRGVVLKEGQDLRALYEERTPLYEKYADFIIECDGKMLREVVEEIASILNLAL